MTDITRLEKETELVKIENEEKSRELHSKNGEIKFLKTQLKEKDEEIKSYLERAISAEKKLEFLKEEKRK